MTDATQHKNKLLAYFNGDGFERWSAIYGQAEVSRIRQTIRDGHAAMLAQAQEWLVEALGSRQLTADSSQTDRPSLLDAGCGTGLFTLALAQRGFDVTAVDIAPQPPVQLLFCGGGEHRHLVAGDQKLGGLGGARGVDGRHSVGDRGCGRRGGRRELGRERFA